MQQLRHCLLHLCTVMYRLSLADIGTGVWFLELSNRSLRWDSANLAKRVAYLQRAHKRARADVQLAESDTMNNGKNATDLYWMWRL